MYVIACFIYLLEKHKDIVEVGRQAAPSRTNRIEPSFNLPVRQKLSGGGREKGKKHSIWWIWLSGIFFMFRICWGREVL